MRFQALTAAKCRTALTYCDLRPQAYLFPRFLSSECSGGSTTSAGLLSTTDRRVTRKRNASICISNIYKFYVSQYSILRKHNAAEHNLSRDLDRHTPGTSPVMFLSATHDFSACGKWLFLNNGKVNGSTDFNKTPKWINIFLRELSYIPRNLYEFRLIPWAVHVYHCFKNVSFAPPGTASNDWTGNICRIC